MVIGGKVIKGKVINNTKVEVVRDDKIISSGEITELQSAKQAVNEVVEGQECGINFVGSPEIEEGDVLSVYEEEQKAKII